MDTRLREILLVPLTAVRWWRRMTTAPAAERWLVLVGLPVVLTLSWLSGLGGSLAFRLGAESLWASERTVVTAFTANYAHLHGRHLFDNLLNFWVTLFAIYPLVAIAGWGSQFRRSLLVYLFAVPFVIAGVSLAVLETNPWQVAVGFSGIVAALLGFLPVVGATAACAETDGAVSPAWAIVPFFASLGLVFSGSSTATASPGGLVGAGWLTGAVVAGGLCWWADRPLHLRPRFSRLSDDHRLAFLIGMTVFVFGVFGAFVFVGSTTNVWGHLAGYVAGFVFPYCVFVVFPALATRLR